mmetsp:Transcript_1746/g.2382  ORF Transcript_1746/g.2382 Transcript_1746/m.2382 type:complete len:121 (+) Transcript_1746:53-415(+)
MLRRTFLGRFQMNKGPQYPGPTLAGWGRTTQKRRLEYETTESRVHKRMCAPGTELAGYESRTTDYMEMRVWSGWPGRIGLWLTNFSKHYALMFLPGCGPLFLVYYGAYKYDQAMQRWAWW